MKNRTSLRLPRAERRQLELERFLLFRPDIDRRQALPAQLAGDKRLSVSAVNVPVRSLPSDATALKVITRH